MRISLRAPRRIVDLWGPRLRERLGDRYALEFVGTDDDALCLGLARVVEAGLFGDRLEESMRPARSNPPIPGPDADLVLTLRVDGASDGSSLVGRLLTREPPLLEVVDGDGRVLATSYAAVESPHQLSKSVDRIGARVFAMWLRAIERHQTETIARAEVLPLERGPTTSGSCMKVAGALSGRLGSALVRRLAPSREPTWRLAVRGATQGSPWDDVGAWTPLEHDGFLADPCLHQGPSGLHIFAEALAPGRARGVIACAPVSEAGTAGSWRTVLEATHHLSYPFVFSHDGETFMVPESGASGRVELFRAKHYPYEWVREALLVEGPRLVDATLLHRNGLWWLFAGGAEVGDSTHDQLFIYFSEALTGPWRAHPRRPIWSDCRNARPAGALIEVGGTIFRPSQNNSQRYGGGLVWSEVIELTPDGYQETQVANWSGSDFGDCLGVHTFSRAGKWEAVDLLTRKRRF